MNETTNAADGAILAQRKMLEALNNFTKTANTNTEATKEVSKSLQELLEADEALKKAEAAKADKEIIEAAKRFKEEKADEATKAADALIASEEAISKDRIAYKEAEEKYNTAYANFKTFL